MAAAGCWCRSLNEGKANPYLRTRDMGDPATTPKVLDGLHGFSDGDP
jgi:hypothetical protein